MRKILIGVAVLAILVAIPLCYLSSNLDTLVARMIEKYGTEATGTAVNVAGVTIDLRAGRGTIRGLSVANPPGFSGRPAFSLGEVVLDLDVDALGSSPLAIDEIVVSRPVVRLEVDNAGRANLEVLRTNLQRNTTATEETPEETQAEPIRLRVDRFVFEEGALQADTSAVGGEEREIVLPSVRLNEVGGEQGATPGSLGRIVLSALAEQAARTAARSELEGYARGKLAEELERRGVEGVDAGDATDAVEKGLGKAADKARELFR
jgi:hypothetical protein